MLAAGGLIGFPTETVYGLGADATNPGGHRPALSGQGPALLQSADRPCRRPQAARKIARFDALATRLAEAFWPGPLTLVLPKASGCAVADLATAGLDTVAIRIPAHPVAREILQAFGGPMVAPSANLSGHVSPTIAAHVQDDLAGRIDLIVDGGPVDVGVESTIVGCFAVPILLRPGGLPRGAIERVLGRALAGVPQTTTAGATTMPLAPGMLASHYAPRSRSGSKSSASRPARRCWHSAPGRWRGSEAAVAVMNLSVRGDLAEAAANLFGYLRSLDDKGARGIAVMPVPDHGLGEAINDRLRRAAIGRS